MRRKNRCMTLGKCNMTEIKEPPISKVSKVGKVLKDSLDLEEETVPKHLLLQPTAVMGKISKASHLVEMEPLIPIKF